MGAPRLAAHTQLSTSNFVFKLVDTDSATGAVTGTEGRPQAWSEGVNCMCLYGIHRFLLQHGIIDKAVIIGDTNAEPVSSNDQGPRV